MFTSNKNSKVSIFEIFLARGIVKQFALRDFKVRYKYTKLGYLWAVLNPLINSSLYFFVFGLLVKVPTPEYNAPYAAVLIAAFLLWNTLLASAESASNGLLYNMHIVTKVYFPRVTLPFASSVTSLFDFLIAFLVTIPILYYFDAIKLSWNILIFPVLAILCYLLGSGLGLFFAILKVSLKDFRHVQPIIMQLLFFGSPVVYTSSLIPEKFKEMYDLNPIASIIEVGRGLLFNPEMINFSALVYGSVFSFIVFGLGVFFFNYHERKVVDLE